MTKLPLSQTETIKIMQDSLIKIANNPDKFKSLLEASRFGLSIISEDMGSLRGMKDVTGVTDLSEDLIVPGYLLIADHFIFSKSNPKSNVTITLANNDFKIGFGKFFEEVKTKANGKGNGKSIANKGIKKALTNVYYDNIINLRKSNPDEVGKIVKTCVNRCGLFKKDVGAFDVTTFGVEQLFLMMCEAGTDPWKIMIAILTKDTNKSAKQGYRTFMIQKLIDYVWHTKMDLTDQLITEMKKVSGIKDIVSSTAIKRNETNKINSSVNGSWHANLASKL